MPESVSLFAKLASNFGLAAMLGTNTMPATLSRSIGIDRSGLQRVSVARLIMDNSRDMPQEDRAILLAIAEQESNFSIVAKNPKSSAHGIFQIVDSTWRGLGKKFNERRNPVVQVQAGIELYKENQEILKARNKGHLSGARKVIEMYVLHHDGPGGVDYGGRRIAKVKIVPKFNKFMRMLSVLN